ncbi:MAG: hypothetical protein ACFFFO_16470 [Candidatus Thorarchaeota archaeon]
MPGRFNDILFRGLTGVTREGLMDLINSGKAPPELQKAFLGMGTGFENMDKKEHALSSYLIAKRFGSPISTAAGYAQELSTGLAEKRAGKPFVSPTGFDPADLAANEVGLRQAEEEFRKRKDRAGTLSLLFMNRLLPRLLMGKK